MKSTTETYLKKLLIAGILLLWFIPLVQYIRPAVELRKLNGAFQSASDDTLTSATWFDGTYTANKDKYLNEQFGFRNFFVRLRNSVFYSVFSVPTANGVIIGKDNYLYEEKYINSYTGQDFIGEEALREKFKKLKFITDTLKKLNVDVIVAFAAGKATYYPEYIPDRYYKNADTVNTNYKWAAKIVKELGLNVIDYNALLKAKKSTTEFPLYPKTGIHWSVYGSYYALDTLISCIEKLKHKSLPHFRYDKVEWSYTMKDPDEDIALALNTLKPPKPFKMPYPTLEFYDTLNYRPKLLTIADSYWGNLYYSYASQHIFEKPEYWYFYAENLDYGPGATDPLTYSLKNKIENTDVVLLMFTESHIGNFGYGFIEDAYALYTKKDYSQKDRQYALGRSRIKGWILTNPKWMYEVKQKARNAHVSFDSMMTVVADSQITQYNMFNVALAPTPVAELVAAYIKTNTQLMKPIAAEAEQKKTPVNILVQAEAQQAVSAAKKISLLASNNKYVCADLGSNNIVAVNRDNASTWETFSLLALKDETFVLSTFTETVFSLNAAEQNNINANHTQITASEIVTIIELENGYIAVKAANGCYWSVNTETQQLFANAKSIGEKEKFKIKYW